MEVVHDDDNTVEFLDEAGMTYMALLIDGLNSLLKEHGVAEAERMKEICSSLLFHAAYNLDAGWFVQGDTKLFPRVFFAERAVPGPDENLGAISRLHVPTEASSWHEYAHGVASQYFEEDDEEVAGVRTGSYDIEN